MLYVSSPIGLGHARRDLAIADELRTLRPGLEVHWLAQHPVTELLGRRSELIHPASAFLASESGHFESEAAEHDLHAFQAVRTMDEILVSNFMVFSELVEHEHFDLWVGDEAWDIDYFLHENPELKRAPYAWMTDFVGWLPMPDGGAREQALTADYNAEMIEQIARCPRLRDRAVFVGNPDDVVPQGFGDGLPAIRDWVEQNYEFSGYVSGFDQAGFADRDALRAELGYRPMRRSASSPSAVPAWAVDLLRRAAAAFPAARRLVPGLRMVVVTGPRIDPESLAADGLAAVDGLDVRAYVHDLYRHLAACDLAVVQGGLTTTMELTASQRPFIYIPLRHHFEQNFHVRHRLDRYGAGRCLDYDQTVPEVWPRPSRTRSRARSVTGRSRPTAPPAPRPVLAGAHLSSRWASRTSRSTYGRPCSVASRAARSSSALARSRSPSRIRARPSTASAAARAESTAPGPRRPAAAPAPRGRVPVHRAPATHPPATGRRRSRASRHRPPGCWPVPATRPPRRAWRASRWRRPAERRNAAGRPPCRAPRRGQAPLEQPDRPGPVAGQQQGVAQHDAGRGLPPGVLVLFGQLQGPAAQANGLVLAAAQPRQPAQVSRVPRFTVRVTGPVVELDGRLDGGGGLLPVRCGDGQERAFELRPLQQEQVAQTAQHRVELGEHIGQGVGIAEAEVDDL